jgi:hypothetical protein
VIAESNENNNAGALAFSVVAPLTSSASPSVGAMNLDVPQLADFFAAVDALGEQAADQYKATLKLQ